MSKYVKVHVELYKGEEVKSIIGRRVINPGSMKLWNYICVYYSKGLKMKMVKVEKRLESKEIVRNV